MLIELYGRNFGCFRDDFSLSLLATDIDPNSSRGIVEVAINGEEEPLKLLRVAAIYGPNASGKSTVLRAAAALRNLLENTGQIASNYPLRMYEPFALDDSRAKPAHLGIKAVLDSDVYEYSVSFTGREIVEEKLERLSGESPAMLFSRDPSHVEGEWVENEHFAPLKNNFRKNALLLVLVDMLSPKLAGNLVVALKRLFGAISPATQARYYSRALTEHVTAKIQRDERFRSWLVDQISAADLGVSDINIEKEIALIQRGKGKVEEEVRERLQLLHNGPAGAYPIRFNRESAGTQRLIEISPAIYNIFYGGSPAGVFADELDASLHPVLFRHLVNYLNSSGGILGQIVFTAHETSILDCEAKDACLRRDQIYFTEKQADGVARLYSLAEFRVRNVNNIRKRYLQGRYGALPAIQDLIDYDDTVEGQ